MKRILAAAAALSLLLPGLSLAQSNQPGPPGGQERHGGRPAAPAGRPAGPSKQPPGPPQRPLPQRPASPGQAAQARPPARPPVGHPTPGRRPPIAAQPLPPRGNQYWHRGRYYARIRGPAFRYPRGWGYRRWTIGGRLPALFLAPAYFYGGWAALGLAAAPPGYAWVRYGPDLLEVNLATGEIDDVIYGVFY
ncbi:MAG TPA: RcnB family protein [Acetobacteraceae bacterium]|nr:RcnB family protein [Acetobacteraceae bacterium]